MSSPSLLLVLLGLPLAAAAVIVAVSLLRRGRPPVPVAQARHRFQSDTAAVQGAVPPLRPRRRITSGRERRADAAGARQDG